MDEFNKELIIKAYKLLNLEEESKVASNQQEEIRVKFLPRMTSQHVMDKFDVMTNGSHLIFSKKNMSLEGNYILCFFVQVFVKLAQLFKNICFNFTFFDVKVQTRVEKQTIQFTRMKFLINFQLS